MVAGISKRLPAAERRQSILDAALTVLSNEGYGGMTTSRLAHKVGITEPILYRHFSSKRALLRALLDEVIARMTAAFYELIKDETDPVAALRRICRAYPELAQRYNREFRVINQALAGANDPATHKILARHYDAYRAFLQKLIESGQRAGVLRQDIPAAMGAWHIIHSALGFLMTQPIRRGAQSSKKFEHLTEAAITGLLKIA
jgi:AcrR family transcriptional regulator